MRAFMMFDGWPLVEVLRTYRAPNDGNHEADVRYLDGPAKGVETSCALRVLMSEAAVRKLVLRLDAQAVAVAELRMNRPTESDQK